MKLLQKTMAASLSALAITGCVGRTIEMNPVAVPANAFPVPITAEACGFQLLIGIPLGTNSRLWRAYQKLKAKAGDFAITDVKMQETWMYAVIGTTYCTRLHATAVLLDRDGA